MILYKVIPQEGMGADQEMQSLVRLGEEYRVLISAELWRAIAVQLLEVIGHCSNLEEALRNILHENEHRGLDDFDIVSATMMVSESNFTNQKSPQ